MGLFSRNTMSLHEMGLLVSFVSLTTLSVYGSTGYWTRTNERRDLALEWLNRKGHMASFWKLSKLLVVANNIARMVIAQTPELAHAIGSMTLEEENELRNELYHLSTSALIAGNHTN